MLYPDFKTKEYNGSCLNHSEIFLNIDEKEQHQEIIEKFYKCAQFCKEKDLDKIIISWEHYISTQYPNVIKQVIQALKCNFKIILYLKRQDLLLESAWKQWVHKDPKYESIQEYVQTNDLNYLELMKTWFNYFKHTDFILRPFERNTIGDDIRFDFLKIIGIKDFSGFSFPEQTNKNTNKGFNPEIIEILKLCKSLIKDSHDHSVIDFMSI